MSAEHFVAETSFYVRYAETDAMGIVHHASYIVYFEEARSHYSRIRGMDYADFERSGFFLAVSEVHVRYRVPARYGQLITCRCWVEEIKSRSVAFGYEVIDAERALLVTGQSKHICLNKDGQVAVLPQSWRNKIAGDGA